MPSTPFNSVLLLHTLPDGSSHFDWLFDTAPEADLLTFRVQAAVPRLGVGSQLLASKLPDHRRIYLSFEGPLTENRGSVCQTARAKARLTIDPAFIRIETTWSASRQPQLWLGRPDSHLGSNVWRFVSLPISP